MGFRGLGLGSGPTVSTSVLSPVKWSETLCFPVVFHGESELCTLSSVHSEWPEINVKRGTHCWCQATGRCKGLWKWKGRLCVRDQGSIRGQAGAPRGPEVKSIPGQGGEHESGEQQNVAEFQKMMRGGGECVCTLLFREGTTVPFSISNNISTFVDSLHLTSPGSVCSFSTPLHCLPTCLLLIFLHTNSRKLVLQCNTVLVTPLPKSLH